MTDIDIQNLRFDRREVGKTFSSSKILHIWEFILNKKPHKILFYDSRLSYKKKLVLDDSVLYYEKFSEDFFSYKFSLGGCEFQIFQTNINSYDININGRSYKKYMSDERNGILDRERERKEEIENEEREIDEYNERALKYNGSNYYEGMEYEIIERQKEKERERELERQSKREEEEDDEFFDEDIDVNQIKQNIENTMNKTRGNQINDNNLYRSGNNSNNNGNQFFNNNNNNFYNSNNNINNNILDIGSNGNRNNNINQGNNYFNFGFINNNNYNQNSNNNMNVYNNNGYYNNNYNNRNNFNNNKYNENIFNNNGNNFNSSPNIKNNNNFNDNNNINNNININNFFNNNINNNPNDISKQFDTMSNDKTNITQTDSFFNTDLSMNLNNNGRKQNKFKEEIMKSGLVNLNNLFEEPKKRNDNSQKFYEDKLYKNNDDSFEF